MSAAPQEKAPTAFQLELLRRIADFIAKHGYCPTLVEVGTYRDNLEVLRARGLITWEPGKSGRTLRLTQRGIEVLKQHQKEHLDA